jgi:hypothetical protein
MDKIFNALIAEPQGPSFFFKKQQPYLLSNFFYILDRA